MKKYIFLIALLASFGTSIVAQSNKLSSESILNQKSYNIDLPTYKKAKLIVDRLLNETTLNEQKIIEILDEMVADPTPVERQILIRFYGLPILIDTGNPQLDQKNYNKAKEEWILKNPKKHQKLMNSNHVHK
jgi:hypothetical protein